MDSSSEFTAKPRKEKKVTAKVNEEVPAEDIPKLRQTPLVLQSPRKPFTAEPEPEKPKLSTLELPREKKKRRSFKLPKTAAPLSETPKITSFDQPDKKKKFQFGSHVGDLNFEREGFLNFKEKNSKLNRWHRRWVILNETLSCHKDIFSEPLLEIQLSYAAVKKNQEKPTQFEIITSGVTYVFSTDNERENVDDWITSITNVCERLVLSSIEDGTPEETEAKRPVFLCSGDASEEIDKSKKALEDILALSLLPHNSVCADCGDNSPEWASTNLGTFICLECSGVHRSFGTHISQVRSVRLDKWIPSQVNFMAAMGNVKANQLWEYNIPPGIEKMTASSSRKQRENFLKLKYICGRFKKDYSPPVFQGGSPLFQQLLSPTLMKDSALEKLRADREFCKHLHDVIFNS